MSGKPAFSQAEMEAVARKRGYRSYAHMIQVMRTGAPRSKQDGGGAQPQGNFLQRLWNDPGKVLGDAFSWHPAKTVRYASDRMREAREK